MCIICVELEKSLISPLEARRNLAEMAFDLDLDHFLELEDLYILSLFANSNIFPTLLGLLSMHSMLLLRMLTVA